MGKQDKVLQYLWDKLKNRNEKERTFKSPELTGLIYRTAQELKRELGFGSIRPADFCYNTFNKSPASFKYRYLVKLKWAKYLLVGPDHRCNRELYFKLDSAKQVLVGFWQDGHLFLIQEQLKAVEPSGGLTNVSNVGTLISKGELEEFSRESQEKRDIEASFNEENSRYEGHTKSINVNKYERNPALKRKCVEHHGCYCSICGFNFFRSYGKPGYGFIQVHHLIPLSKIKKKHKVDPLEDMIPICSNCHSIIHRQDPCYKPEEVKMMINAKRK